MVFVAAFAVYWFTLAPTVWVGDCGELIAAAHTLGVPHPTGYPLWLLLTKLFTLVVPFGSIAWRANLFSALCGALACELLSRALRRLGASRLAAIGGGLSLALLAPIWGESTVALTYSLAAAFSAAMLWCVARWVAATELHRDVAAERSRSSLFASSDRWLIAHNFLYGFGLANHLMVWAHAPALLAVVLGRRWAELKRPRLWAAALLAVAPGLALYAYLPWRASARPALDYRVALQPDGEAATASTPPSNWHFYDLHGDATDSSAPERSWSHVAGVYLRRDLYQERHWATSFADDVGASLRDHATIVAHHAWVVAKELSPFWIPVGVAFLVVGVVAAWRARRRSLLVAVALLWFGNLAPLALHGAWWDVFLYPRYMTTGFVGAALLVGLGVAATSEWLAKRAGRVGQLAAALALPTLLLAANWRACDRREAWLAEDYARALYDQMVPGTQFLAGSDSALYPMFALRFTQDVRTDVDLVNPTQTLVESELLAARRAQRRHEPLPSSPRPACTVDWETPFDGLERQRDGLLFRLTLPRTSGFSPTPGPPPPFDVPRLRGLERDDEPDPYARSLIATIEADLADGAALRGERDEARRRLERVARLAAPRPWGAHDGVTILKRLADGEFKLRRFDLAREDFELARRLVESARDAGDPKDGDLGDDLRWIEGGLGLVDAEEFRASDPEKSLDGLRRAGEVFERYAVVYVQELVARNRFDVARRELDRLRALHRGSRALDEADAKLRALGH
jgi:hypothetical protein